MTKRLDYVKILDDLLFQMNFEKAPALCQMDLQEWPDPKIEARCDYIYAHRLPATYKKGEPEAR